MPDFWKITPGGNPTILLETGAVPRALRARAAAEIMDPLHLSGEQVGFVRFASPSEPTPRLDMMGGEFCLNATRAFAALLAREGCLNASGPDRWSGSVEVSGADGPVAVRVRRVPAFHAPAGWTAGAGLSFKTSRPSVVKENASLIRVPGIAHILLENISPPPTDALPAACAELRARFDRDAEDAVGCLWLDTRSDPPILYPVVWVRATQSLCTESACGSGTLACALALRARCGDSRFAIRQPGGDVLTVSFEPETDTPPQIGKTRLVWVDGPVRFVAEGRLFLACLQV